MGVETAVFRLGRSCTLLVDNAAYPLVGDVYVRQTVTTADVTGWNHDHASELVTHRTYEVEVEVPDLVTAEALRKKAWTSDKLPGVVELWLKDGLFEIRQDFLINEIVGNETLDSVVVARFQFTQWGHGK